ncbi:DEAD/DEAH box helicase [Streptomyces sp. NPDC006743]|uniref:DEAD/DEAH box helicase n=1 Tax=Streptomyces sp. NPDC006743 TaxID=3154480 RepID=UPI0034529752
MTLPVALSGTDVIGQAKTGTGKTLGFGLPLLERVTVPADVEAGRATPEALTDAPQALVVVPTRELCVQVTNDLLTAGKVRNVRVLAIYGGRAYEPQVEALKKGVDVVVGTPGRLLDLAGQKKLDLKHVRALVLDEADEMLDLGFLPDVEKIIGMLPAKRQTMLFSATMPGAVIGLARRYMSRPTHIRATAPDDEGVTVANIKQFVYRAHNMDKPEMVARILQSEGRGLAMIFCRTKRTAADIAEQLQRRGFASGAVHGDLGQGAREQALRAFRNGKVDVLVCTDVAARGIDVEGVTHVINYQSPEDEKTYLHRVGRTGRAGAKGTAITLVDWDDIPRWQLINKALELDFNDPVETYSSSPHLFSDLGIPEGTKGTLPRSERTRAGLAAEELEDLGETGGRGARGRGGRGGRPEGRSADREPERDRERPERTPRRRRRTRNGAPVDPAAPVAGTSAVAAPAEPASAEETAGPRTPRRRRRTRAGAHAQQAAPAAVTATEPVTSSSAATTQPAEAPVTEAPALDTPQAAAAVEAVEAVEKPRRRRTRKAAQPTATTAVTASESAPAEAVTAVPEAGAEAAAPAPRRRTRKAATAEVTAETVTDTAEAAPAEAKPKRTRKTAAPEATATDTAEAPEAEAKPKRATRKKATAHAPETAEAGADTAEGTLTEAKPKRAPRKKAATAEVTAETVTDTAEAAPAEAKPKRTRKTAAPEATATDTAEAPEAEAKPKRATRKKATAHAPETAEAGADTAEGTLTEAKPKRTRKTAAPKATATDTAEAPEAEAKPKRTTRKKATAQAPETAEAGEAEAKPRRRARKAAGSADAAGAEIPAQATGEPEAAPRRRARKTAAAVESAEA